jgi:hypothetical protein
MDDRERLVGLIYEGVTNDEVWQELLALLGDRLNAAGTGLGLQHMATHEFRAVAGPASIQASTRPTAAWHRKTESGRRSAAPAARWPIGW